MDCSIVATPLLLLSCFVSVIPLLTYILSSILFFQAKRKNGAATAFPTAPYWLPGFYHTAEIGSNSARLFSKALTRYGHLAPFLIRAGPIRFAVITDPTHVKTVFRYAKTLTTTLFHTQVFRDIIGSPDHAVKLYMAENNTIKLAHFALPRQYFSGASLEEISELLTSIMRENVQAKDFHSEEWTFLPDLYAFIRSEVSRAIFEALLGPGIFKQYPSVIDDFWQFDGNIGVYSRGLPRFLAPAAYELRDRLLKGLKNWLQDSETRLEFSKIHPGQPAWDQELGSKFFRHRNNMLGSVPEMDLDARAAEVLGLLLAANSSTIPFTFWFIFEAIRNPVLLGSLSEELGRFHDPKSHHDMGGICSVPLFQSMQAEVGRLRMAIVTIRSSDKEDFQLDDKHSISRHTQVMIFTQSLAFDKKAWTRARPQAVEKPLEDFWAERFLRPKNNNNDKTPRAPSSKAAATTFSMEGLGGLHILFGGGQGLCPGRHLAKSIQIRTFALVMSEYEVELIDPIGAEKQLPLAEPRAFGAMMPRGNIPIRIRKRRRLEK